MTAELKQAAQVIRQHPNILVLYFAVRLFTFAFVITFFGVEFKVDVLDKLNQNTIAAFFLLPLASLGVIGWVTRKYYIAKFFVSGFFVWNAFLISVFLRAQAFNYIGLYAFAVDASFSVLAMYLLRLRKLRLASH